MKYRVGDKVKIRGNIEPRMPSEDKIGISEMMMRYKGQIATIKAVEKGAFFRNHSRYKLDIDDQRFNWTDDMVTEPSRIKVY